MSQPRIFGKTLSNQSFHEDWFVEGPVILVGDGSVDVALKEREHGEPNPCSAALLEGSGVGKRVVVEEEAGGDVEGDKHVDGVVFVSRQDEENPKQVQHPGNGVDQIPGTWSVFSHKEVEQCDDNSVSTEHVVSTGLNTSQRHTKSTPDCKCPLHLSPGITICLTSTFQVLSRHRERGNKHGATPKQKHRSHQGTEPPEEN